jgi:DNA polymerase-3 subunit delta'
MNALLPWHRPHWQNLIERVRTGKLPHALLLSGPAGIGKNQFATQWAQTVLCETGVSQGQACGQCRSCLLYAADSHPDLRRVRPLEPGKVIGVDQVREVSQYLSQTSQYGGHKAVIVTPAEQMNINAANSLLKTLEEPSEGSLILLVTDKPGRLPATILSRCQRIDLTVPGTEEATQWLAGQVAPELDVDLILALAEGAPLRALELAESNALAERSMIMQELERLAQGDANASGTAEQFLKIGAQQTLYWMYHWVADMIRHASGGSEANIVNRDMRERLTRLAQRVELRNLHAYIRQVSEALRMTGGQLNPQLAMENMLMAWQDTFLVRD